MKPIALIFATITLVRPLMSAADTAPVSGTPAPADTPAPAVVAPVPKVPSRCRLLLASDGKKEPWYRLTASGEYAPVAVSADWLGAPLDLPTDGAPLTLWRRTSAPEAAPEYVPVVALPAAGPAQRIVLLTQSKGKWVAEAVSDEAGVFPNGSILAVNRSGVRLRLDFGGSALELDADATGVIAAPKEVRHESAAIRITKLAPAGDVLVFSSSWPWSAARRNILFARSGAATRIEIAGIDDIREPDPAPPTPVSARPVSAAPESASSSPASEPAISDP